MKFTKCSVHRQSTVHALDLRMKKKNLSIIFASLNNKKINQINPIFEIPQVSHVAVVRDIHREICSEKESAEYVI